jgi:pilus assembly protein CpaE
VGNEIQFAILDDSRVRRQTIKCMLEKSNNLHLVLELDKNEKHVQTLIDAKLHVVLVVVDIENADNTNLVKQLFLLDPRVAIIVLSEHKDWHFVRQYMRAGAKDYLYLPVDSSVLLSTITDVVRMNNAVTQLVTQTTESKLLEKSARILTFCSRKGGVGKTTLAVNLAVSLANFGRRTAFVDFTQSSTMLYEMIGMEPKRSLLWLDENGRLAQQSLNSCLAYDEQSGVFIFESSLEDNKSNIFNADTVRMILNELRKQFDFIVIDTASYINDFWWEVANQSTQCWIVSNLDTVTLKDNGLFLRIISERGFRSKCKVVINNFDLNNILNSATINGFLDIGVSWEFGCDTKLVESSTQHHLPFVLFSPKSLLSQQMKNFAQTIISEYS